MNHEVFHSSASKSQLTGEWLAYLVSNLPSLSILSCKTAALIEIIVKNREYTSTLASGTVILIISDLTGWCFSVEAQILDMWLHTQSHRDKIHTPWIKVLALNTHTHMLCQTQQMFQWLLQRVVGRTKSMAVTVFWHCFPLCQHVWQVLRLQVLTLLR